MGGKNQFAMALQVSMSSMGFQGVCLSLEESDEDYAGLVPLLDQLPWEAGHINLGKTEEERIAEGTYTAGDPVWERSCGWSKSIEWKGKTLTISSDNGGFGSGAQVTDACDNFNALASQSSKYSTKHRAELLMTLEPQHELEPQLELVMEPQHERMTLEPQPEVPFYSGPVSDADGNQIAFIEAPATLESEDPKLDTLCADLERIATEMEVTEIIEVRQPEMTREVLRAAEPREVTSCCRMLGEVNGRSNFKEQALVSWGDDGSLQLS